jgi:hypothetical protein
MKTQLLCAFAVLLVLASCERQFPTTIGVISSDLYPIIQTTNVWTIPANPRPGTVVTLEMIYNSYSPVKEINLLQVINRTVGTTVTRDTTRSATFPYQAAYSAAKGGDTLLLNYTIPTIARPMGTTVSLILIGEVVTQANLNKRRATTAVAVPAM